MFFFILTEMTGAGKENTEERTTKAKDPWEHRPWIHHIPAQRDQALGALT
jgi:hypothetical protein